MPIVYPTRKFGRYRLGMGLAYKLIHDRFGFELGQRYHRDVDYRIRTTMEIDRAVFEVFGRIGLGFEEPFPRVSIEPFGHRFMPAMYGCDCAFAEDGEPWSRPRVLSREEIMALPPWTAERFASSEPVKAVLSQVHQLQKCYESYRVPDKEFQPHYRGMSAVQNLGSVINTAFSLQGERLLVDYVDDPQAVRALYGNITQLMLLCLDRFSAADGWPLADIFVGNCTVSMISPRQYAELNEAADRRLMDYARSTGARFMVHQDSDVDPHLANYGRLEYVHSFDVGQDTDFETLHRLCPQAAVNCILFPAWVKAHGSDDIRAELRRLMRLGARFPAFSFTLLEIDDSLAGEPLFGFCESFEQSARSAAHNTVTRS
jgi:hypothetical protein